MVLARWRVILARFSSCPLRVHPSHIRPRDPKAALTHFHPGGTTPATEHRKPHSNEFLGGLSPNGRRGQGGLEEKDKHYVDCRATEGGCHVM